MHIRMRLDPSQFILLSHEFLSKVSEQLIFVGFSIPGHWDIDHLCYRVETLERYQEMKRFLSSFAMELAENEINGRPITTFKLFEPILWQGHQVDLLELPAPKTGKFFKEGFEHIEIVCDVPFSELKARFSPQELDESGLRKPFNQELELKLRDCAVKFHHLSLESVVMLESNKPVFEGIQKLRLLDKLHAFQPLIAGTYPLGIQTENSDVDILLSAQNLDELYQVYDSFSSLPGFLKHRALEMEEEYALCRFTVDNIPIELFGQRTASISQKAYRHFQTEERLLKLGGSAFRDKIMLLRSQGHKTEPAFAKALGLHGNPYETLLGIHGYSTAQLSKLLESQ